MKKRTKLSAYESDHTQFINQWLQEHPQELELRREGRGLWWDHPQNLEQLNAFKKADVPTNPYYYDYESLHNTD